MSFILSADRVDGPATVQAFVAYQKYLASVRDQLPSGVAQIALADWYYDPMDHRCPHDAWLESMALRESGHGEHQEIRSASMTVRLLGAYHDGHIELQYRDVTRYTLDFTSESTQFGGHRDWLYDEFRLTPIGRVEHEIEWAGRTNTGHWIIEAADLEYRWSPM
jgi:hypothetical protein